MLVAVRFYALSARFCALTICKIVLPTWHMLLVPACLDVALSNLSPNFLCSSHPSRLCINYKNDLSTSHPVLASDLQNSHQGRCSPTSRWKNEAQKGIKHFMELRVDESLSWDLGFELYSRLWAHLKVWTLFLVDSCSRWLGRWCTHCLYYPSHLNQ